MTVARTISVASCRRGHLHLVLTREDGTRMLATLDQGDWERFVKAGDNALVTRGLAPCFVTFELESAPCPDLK